MFIIYLREVCELSEREIKLSIIEKAEIISKLLSKGKDVEIRKVRDEVTVAEVKRAVVK